MEGLEFFLFAVKRTKSLKNKMSQMKLILDLKIIYSSPEYEALMSEFDLLPRIAGPKVSVRILTLIDNLKV